MGRTLRQRLEARNAKIDSGIFDDLIQPSVIQALEIGQTYIQKGTQVAMNLHEVDWCASNEFKNTVESTAI